MLASVSARMWGGEDVEDVEDVEEVRTEGEGENTGEPPTATIQE